MEKSVFQAWRLKAQHLKAQFKIGQFKIGQLQVGQLQVGQHRAVQYQARHLKGWQQVMVGTLDRLLPPSCPLCRSPIQETGHFCINCWSDFEQITPPFCAQCGLPFADHAGSSSLEGASETLLCAPCLKNRPAFDAVYAPVLYEGAGRQAVLALKHGRRFMAVPAIARMMSAALKDTPLYELVVPVPLHAGRLLSRRFNQSQLLAAHLAKARGWRLAPALLRRERATPSQGPLGRMARFKNVKKAFSVAPGKDVRGLRVLLVDDVLTTGATASACAEALKQAGATSVDLAVFARVGLPVED